jgi:RNA polymerase sigma-70 factor (ECF subfamily)
MTKKVAAFDRSRVRFATPREMNSPGRPRTAIFPEKRSLTRKISVWPAFYWRGPAAHDTSITKETLMSRTPLFPRFNTAQLVVAAQSGDREAFGQLYQHFHGQLLAFCRRRTSHDAEAQELCQDVFLQAMRKVRSLRDPAAFGGWLRTIATRLGVNRYARRRPIATSSSEVLDIEGREHVSPLENILATESHQQVRAGLKQLKDLDRRTLEAFYVQGQTLTEMSETFDAPVGTIKRRLFDARKRLAAVVEVASALGAGI